MPERYPGHHPEFSGEWRDGVAWRFYLSQHMPPGLACGAVAAIAIVDTDRAAVALTYTERTLQGGVVVKQWENPAGRTERVDPADPNSPWETPKRTRDREVGEEVGGRVIWGGSFGYSLVHDSSRTGPSDMPAESYMRWDWAITDSDLAVPADPKHTTIDVFTPDKLLTLVEAGEMQVTSYTCVLYGLAAARRAIIGGV